MIVRVRTGKDRGWGENLGQICPRSRPGLLQLLMLAPDCEPAYVDWDRHHNLGVSGRLPGLRIGIARLHPFPLGPPVLEPDFDLNFAEFEGVCNLGSLGQRKVFLAVEFLFQFQQLLAGEGRSPPAVFSR